MTGVQTCALPISTRAKAKTALTFLAGGVTGLTVHEAGHVTAGIVFGADPGTKPIRYAGIPFFAVTHDPVTRSREFVISSAGFWIHHAGSEWILTAQPALKDAHAPFLKGMLAFNIGTSLMYSGAAVLQMGPPERDPLGMAEGMHWVAIAQKQAQTGLQLTRVIVLKLRRGDTEEPRRHGLLALKILDDHLQDRDWLAVGRTTIADIACYPYVAKSPEGGFDLPAYPNVLAWVKRCEAQPRWPQRG